MTHIKINWLFRFSTYMMFKEMNENDKQAKCTFHGELHLFWKAYQCDPLWKS